MEFELTRERRLLQLAIREFAEAELRPEAAERERTGEFPWEVIKKLGRMGIFGLIFPKQYGSQRARAKKQIISQREKQVLGWLKLGKVPGISR